MQPAKEDVLAQQVLLAVLLKQQLLHHSAVTEQLGRNRRQCREDAIIGLAGNFRRRLAGQHPAQLSHQAVKQSALEEFRDAAVVEIGLHDHRRIISVPALQ